jgi:glycine/serine hydroxymethyltransferase
MERIAAWITQILAAPADQAGIARVRAQVQDLCAAFPLYREFAEAE